MSESAYSNDISNEYSDEDPNETSDESRNDAPEEAEASPTDVSDTPEARNASFPFPDLPPNSRSIRLLHFDQVDPWQNRPMFDFVTVSLDDAPKYTVLSYVRGCPFPEPPDRPVPDPVTRDRDNLPDSIPEAVVERVQNEHNQDTLQSNDVPVDWDSLVHYIFIDRLAYFVDRNLWDAIRRIAVHKTLDNDALQINDLRLWVDAVCIRPNNVDEQNTHAAIRSDIVAGAEQVICWLGRKKADTRNAEQFVTYLCRETERWGAIPGSARFDVQQPGTVLLRNRIWNRDFRIWAPSPASWGAFATLARRPYFKSLWAVHDFGLARAAVFRCGKYEFTGQGLKCATPQRTFAEKQLYLVNRFGQSGACFDDEYYSLSSFFTVAGRCLQSPASFRQRYRGLAFVLEDSQLPHLALMLSLASSSACIVKNPHDRIYALLGLVRRVAGQPNSLPFRIQHETPVERVYLEVAKSLIMALPILMVLSMVEDRLDRHTPNLATWVPDFNAGERTWVASTFCSFFRAGIAPGGYQMESRTTDGTSLTVQGVFIDAVASYALAFPPGLYYPSKTMLKTILELVVHLPDTYPATNQDRLEALWRTLGWDVLVGVDGDRADIRRATAQMGAYFPQWLATAVVDPVERTWKHHYQSLLQLLLTVLHGSSLGREYLRQQPLRELEASRGVTSFDAATSTMLRVQHVHFMQFCKAAGQKLVRTSKNLLGLALPSVSVGDEVWILRDARLPVVLRRVPGTNTYEFMGEAYLHGFSFGEIFNQEHTFGDVVLV